MQQPKASTNTVEFATLNEKVDNLAATVGKLAEVVHEERRNNAETTKGIYNEITSMRDRVAISGRITWPLVCTTFSAALAFAAIVGGLGSYALNSETSRLNTRLDGVEDKARAANARHDMLMEREIENARAGARMLEWQRLMEPKLMKMPLQPTDTAQN